MSIIDNSILRGNIKTDITDSLLGTDASGNVVSIANGITTEYLHAKITARQNYAPNSYIGDFSVTVAQGLTITNNLVTLKAGKTYLVEGVSSLDWDAVSSSSVRYIWRDTNGVVYGNDAVLYSANYNSEGATSPVAVAIITPTTDIEVGLWCFQENAPTATWVNNGYIKVIGLPHGKLEAITGGSGDEDWLKTDGTSPTTINDDIYTNGNVGIGTNTPSGIMHVANNAAGSTTPVLVLNRNNCGGACGQQSAPSIKMYNSNGNGGIGSIEFFPSTDGSGDSGASINGAFRNATNQTAGLSFSTKGTSTNGTRLVIEPEGYVGINQTNPQAQLHVTTNEGANWEIGSYNNNTSQPTIRANGDRVFQLTGAGGTLYFGKISGAGDLIARAGGVDSFRCIGTTRDVQFYQSVGIGTNVPSERLHVIGNILASGTVTPSDIRIKDNVKDSKYGLDEVLKMRPVDYSKYKDFSKTGESYKETGLIAQELQKIFPEAVTEYEGDTPMSVNYAQIIPVLIKAIQEQQEKIDQLSEKLDTLK